MGQLMYLHTIGFSLSFSLSLSPANIYSVPAWLNGACMQLPGRIFTSHAHHRVWRHSKYRVLAGYTVLHMEYVCHFESIIYTIPLRLRPKLRARAPRAAPARGSDTLYVIITYIYHLDPGDCPVDHVKLRVGPGLLRHCYTIHYLLVLAPLCPAFH